MNGAYSADPEKKTIVVEHSSMGPGRLLRQLYDDAADVGLALYNPATGHTVHWHWKEEKRDGEGDLAVTIFGPTWEDVRKQPQLEGWTLHVLND
jgi:hypothetical protein